MGMHLCKYQSNEKVLDKSLSDVGDYFLGLLTNQKYSPNPLNSYKYTKFSPQLNRLMCLLQENNIEFEDHIYLSEDLLEDSACQWKRVESVFKGEQYQTNNWQFQYNNITPKYENLSFNAAMKWLMQKPTLLQQINIYPKIFEPGLYRYIFWVGGKKQQVIIDSFIPVNYQNKYVFCSPKIGNGVWMILMEKALAKSLGNYQFIRQLSRNQIISQITGLPCPNLYRCDQQSFSYQIHLQPRKSVYFKIGKKQRGTMVLGFWFQFSAQKQVRDRNVVVQLMQQARIQQQRTFKLIQTKQSKTHNIIQVTSEKDSMIDLVMEEEYLHIYNWDQVDLVCNLVVQSQIDAKICLSQTTQSMQKQVTAIKNKMVKNQYIKWHEDPSTTVLDASTYRMRIKEIRHRLIFCIKNKLPNIQKIKIKIKADRKHQIFFEGEPENLQQKQVHIRQSEHKFFVFNKIKSAEYGQFYDILL